MASSSSASSASSPPSFLVKTPRLSHSKESSSHNFKKFLRYLTKKEEKVAPEPIYNDTIINGVNVISPMACAIHIKTVHDYEKFCKIFEMQKRLH